MQTNDNYSLKMVILAKSKFKLPFDMHMNFFLSSIIFFFTLYQSFLKILFFIYILKNVDQKDGIKFYKLSDCPLSFLPSDQFSYRDVSY